MKIEKLKTFMDLTRLHFFFVWPLVFCSGLILSFRAMVAFPTGRY
jgi:hypothetical protein